MQGKSLTPQGKGLPSDPPAAPQVLTGPEQLCAGRAMPSCTVAGGHRPAELPRARLSSRGWCGRLRTRRRPPSEMRLRRRSGGGEGERAPAVHSARRHLPLLVLCTLMSPVPAEELCQEQQRNKGAALRDVRQTARCCPHTHPGEGDWVAALLRRGRQLQAALTTQVCLSMLGSRWHKQSSALMACQQACNHGDGHPLHYTAGRADPCKVEQSPSWSLSPRVAEAKAPLPSG